VYGQIALPMYDWPEVRTATAQLLASLERRLRPFIKEKSSNSELYDHWKDPHLLVSQTCGFPFVSSLQDHAALLLTPHYGAEGCDGPRYASHIVVAEDSAFSKIEDLRGRTAAYNDRNSQSGYNVFRHTIASYVEEGRFFSKTVMSGGHLNSLKLVASGQADVASIDAVCWYLARTYRPELAGRLRSIGTTDQVPGLPLITSAKRSAGEISEIRSAVINVLEDPETEKSRQCLSISGFSCLDPANYLVIADMERGAASVGYPELV